MPSKFQIRDKIFAILLLVISVTIAWLWLSPKGAVSAPEIKLGTLKGKTITLGKINKPVLIVFWATSCTTCIAEVPHLNQIYSRLGPQGVEIIGVAMEYDRSDLVIDMVKRRPINYPVVLDSQGKIFSAFKLKRKLTPTSILIAPNNRIVMLKVGPMNMHYVEKTMADMLSSNTPK